MILRDLSKKILSDRNKIDAVKDKFRKIKKMENSYLLKYIPKIIEYLSLNCAEVDISKDKLNIYVHGEMVKSFVMGKTTVGIIQTHVIITEVKIGSSTHCFANSNDGPWSKWTANSNSGCSSKPASTNFPK